MGQHVSNLEDAISVLKEKDMVVFSDDGNPVEAYPFTMEEREHVIRVRGHQVHAMCALDALSISPMFRVETQIISRCRVTGDPISIKQPGDTIENLDEAGDVHFGIIWGAKNTDSCYADSLCMEMVFLMTATRTSIWFRR
jgi:mercuric reductase